MHAGGQDVAVVGLRERREGHAVRGPRERGDGLPEVVELPILVLADADDAVQAPGGAPHDVGARLVVHRVGDRGVRRADDRAHDALGEVVAHAVVVAREVLLHAVAEDVVAARDHLVARQRVGERGVEQRELGDRAHLVADHLELLARLLVGGDAAAVHLGTGGGDGEDAAHGDHTVLWRDLLPVVVEARPELLGRPLLPRERRCVLGAVDDRAAAHGEHEVDVVLADGMRHLEHLGERGVGRDTRALEDLLARLLERRDHAVVEAGRLGGVPAISEQHAVSVAGELFGQGVERLIAEVDARGQGEGEVAEHGRPPRFNRFKAMMTHLEVDAPPHLTILLGLTNLSS